MNDNYLHSEITGPIIHGFYRVYNNLSYGFLEKVYQNALPIELRSLGLCCQPQAPIHVFYEGTEVGFYMADILVNDLVIVELKAAESLCEQHEAQLTNYLKATNVEVGLLLNFGKIPALKRKVFVTSRKHHNHNKS